MFDIGWSEMAVVALLALLVIGPKDLPRVMKTVGQWVRRARSITREFQSGVDQMIRDAELEDAKKALDATRGTTLKSAIADSIDPTGTIKDEIDSIDRETRKDATVSPPTSSSGSSQDPESSSEAEAEGGSTDGSTESLKDGPEENQGARIIKHPVNVAPPHSITPPEPASALSEEPSGSDAPSSAEADPHEHKRA